MATVQKRKAKWRVQFRRDGHRLSRTFHRKADADEWAREAEHSIDRRMNLAIVRLGRGDICGSLINLHLESLRAERTHFGHPKITSCASSHERSDAALERPDAGTAQSTRPHRGEPKSPSGMARDHPPFRCTVLQPPPPRMASRSISNQSPWCSAPLRHAAVPPWANTI